MYKMLIATFAISTSNATPTRRTNRASVIGISLLLPTSFGGYPALPWRLRVTLNLCLPPRLTAVILATESPRLPRWKHACQQPQDLDRVLFLMNATDFDPIDIVNWID